MAVREAKATLPGTGARAIEFWMPAEGSAIGLPPRQSSQPRMSAPWAPRMHVSIPAPPSSRS